MARFNTSYIMVILRAAVLNYLTVINYLPICNSHTWHIYVTYMYICRKYMSYMFAYMCNVCRYDVNCVSYMSTYMFIYMMTVYIIMPCMWEVQCPPYH